MNEQTLEKMKEFLGREEVQERIQQRILLTQQQVSVPIGVAVALTPFSENQLRKWEARGLLSPQKDGRHRYYSLQDLNKLVIISELLEAKFPLSSIPPDIDRIWRAIVTPAMPQLSQLRQSDHSSLDSSLGGFEHQHINQRIERARQDLFWRYYASHALRISLQLIREGIPSVENAAIGLILPLHVDASTFAAVKQTDELPRLGASLVGWLALSGSSHTLFTPTPSFEYPNLYRLYQLRTMREGGYIEKDGPEDHTLLVTNWKFDHLTLGSTEVAIIRRLLAHLYENAQNVRACFDQGMRDVLDPATDLNSDYPDNILNGLAEIAVRSGKTVAGWKKWRFCCILLSGDTTQPLQLRRLVVRAQSSEAPHKVGKTFVSPVDATISISLRAYQSGQVIYRPEICDEDSAIAFRKLENPASAIALPIEGANDTSLAVLYLVADEPHAFSMDDQRVLRLIGRMVQEVLTIYKARHQASEKLTDIIKHPGVIDTFFELKEILSEDQFVQDIEDLLKDLHMRISEGREKEVDGRGTDTEQPEVSSTDVLSLISIEIDDQARLNSLYGDQFAQNLCKAVGSYLQMQLRRILTDSVAYKLYHACAGGFYLLLNGLSLEEARKHAERIRRKLNETYRVSILRSINENMVASNLDDMRTERISVHIAVTSYTYWKLSDLLTRYSATSPVENVRALICRDIDNALNKGRGNGGNVVFSWNPGSQERGLIRWSPDPSA